MQNDLCNVQVKLMHEAVINLLSRAMDRTMRFPQNSYRQRLYFEGIALLGEDLTIVATAAAALTRLYDTDLRAR
jgi:hypothetical protein